MRALGVDVGGTFTDGVLLEDGGIRTVKVRTARRQEESVLAAAAALGGEAERFAHGTTTATNALLERRGARTAFIANEGFEHLLHLGRQTRAHLYRLCEPNPVPLVPLALCHGVRGRLRCAEAGLPEPLVMRSSGGVASLAEAAAHPVHAVPAAGAAACGDRSSGRRRDALSFDMGGTSTDMCLIRDGRVERTSGRAVGGLPLRLPSVDVHTVGAGGGSIVRRDAGGAIHVGPESAGAEPGPACYGLGGTTATVTDASLLLGRLPAALPAGIRLDRAAAERALVGIDPGDAVALVNAEMVRALRAVSVERGVDPRGLALVAFGGAGPLHACALADELGMRTVLVPAPAGVLSDVGLVAGEERRDSVGSVVRPLGECGELPDEGEADVRYLGQSHELTVPLGGDLAETFHHAHERLYGYADPGRVVEVVALRTAEVRSAPELRLATTEPRRVRGPAVVELPGATCWVPEGWGARATGRERSCWSA